MLCALIALLDNHDLGVLAAAGTAFCWAMTALFFGAAARRIGQFHVNAIRLVIACALLGLACAVTGVFAAAPMAQFVLLALSGLVGLTLGDAAMFSALQILGPRRASLIMALAPGMTALLMVPLLGETLGWAGVAGMTITLAGVMWVVLERGQPGEIQGSVLLGVVMGMLGALGQAGGLILSKAGLGNAAQGSLLNQWSGLDGGVVELHPLFGTLVRMLAGTVILLAYGLAARKLIETLGKLRDRRALAQTTAGATFGPFIGVTLSLAAVQLTNTAVASTIMATSPVLVIPIVAIVYKQKITWRAVAGAIVAVAGVAVLTFRDKF